MQWTPSLDCQRRRRMQKNADKPEVCAAAARNYQTWLDKARAHRAKRKNKDTTPSLYAGLSNVDKQRVVNNALAMLAALHTTSAVSSPPATRQVTAMSQPTTKVPRILIADIIVLSAATGTKGILPAPIVSNFPHIQLQPGSRDKGAHCPVIRCVVDTAAALTTGNFHFVSAVAKRYPHCVANFLCLPTIILSCCRGSYSAEASRSPPNCWWVFSSTCHTLSRKVSQLAS